MFGVSVYTLLATQTSYERKTHTEFYFWPSGRLFISTYTHFVRIHIRDSCTKRNALAPRTNERARIHGLDGIIKMHFSF